MLRVLGFLLLCMATSGFSAHAADPPGSYHQPAATTLVPYFEADLTGLSGKNTLVSINNSSATAVLAHVTVWSTLDVPVLSFNVYLTGYDVQFINMRDLLKGNIPVTASAGQDPNDTISPQGGKSQDINFASCNGILPPPPLDAATKAHIKASLTGLQSPVTGKCAGVKYSDRIARGYVTIDTVNACTLRTPADADYHGYDATFQNVLWGDYTLVEFWPGASVSSPMVAILADNLSQPPAGSYTFYGRFVNWAGTDRRKPLPTNFAARFFNQGLGGAHDGDGAPNKTDFIVWRDPKVVATPFSCGSYPSWYPLAQEGLASFDEQETVASVEGQRFPAVTGRYSGSSLPLPNRGWLWMDLNHGGGTGPSGGVDSDANAAQAWVTTIHRGALMLPPIWGTGNYATPLDSASDANHQGPW